MSWNYRVFRHKSTCGTDYQSFTIHECYYDSKGVPNGWTKDPIEPFGNTLEELENCCKMILKAFKEPVLEYNDKDN